MIDKSSVLIQLNLKREWLLRPTDDTERIHYQIILYIEYIKL